jgi:hypothetical protein
MFIGDVIMALATATPAMIRYTKKEAPVRKAVSHVPELLAERKWTPKMLASKFMWLGGSSQTAYRLARGDTKVSMETLELAVEVFGVESTSDIMDVPPKRPRA